MCKPSDGYEIRDGGAVCVCCGADGAVTSLAEVREDHVDGGGEFHLACEICVETHAFEFMMGVAPVLTYDVMTAHVNQALNIAVEQISARLIEYGDASWTGH